MITQNRTDGPRRKEQILKMIKKRKINDKSTKCKTTKER